MIVCVGDSITYGQHLDDLERPWPMIFASLSGETTISRGVPGDTTRQALERFPRDVQGFGPQMVIIQFGHNDANRWQTDRGLPRVSPTAFRANLIEMVDRTRTFEAVPLLCSLTPTTRSEEFANDCAHYDQIVRRVADEESVQLVDVRAAFSEGIDLLMADGLHLTQKGHERYAETVWRALSTPVPG